MGAARVHVQQPASPRGVTSVESRPRYLRLVTSERPASESEVKELDAFRRLLAPHGTASLVARAWGVSPAYVSLVKAGERKLSTDKIAALPEPLLARFRMHLADSRPAPIQLSFL